MEVVVDLLQVLEGLAYTGFIAGAIFAVWELREMRRDRQTDLILRVMEMTNSPEAQERWTKLFGQDFGSPEEMEEKCGRRMLENACSNYEGLGYLIRKGLIDRQTYFETYGVAEAWEKLKPWAMKQRRTDPIGPRLYVHFEYAAGMEQAYEAKLKRKGV